MIIRFTPDADAELAEARQWYSQQRTDFDMEFMDCIDDALSRVVRDPDLYPVCLQKSQTRRRSAFSLPCVL